jgi:tRNA(Phe) wybutosine-synthesizing methylase Tyw3
MTLLKVKALNHLKLKTNRSLKIVLIPKVLNILMEKVIKKLKTKRNLIKTIRKHLKKLKIKS